MKTVHTPISPNPFICTVNGKKYTYAANTDVSVPDEVATVIEDIVAQNTLPQRDTPIIYGATEIKFADAGANDNIAVLKNGAIKAGKLYVDDNHTLNVE